ncbi:inactive protein RESTRICTED TEV MOVEMENT 2-like [Pistacia vera]|uniref:inactive protein RESTRICTED TEV MOVEMENT 2-like n=1 Tax=Pistacia vera TaxID=55513 RepID=UPI001263161E|nr:inactive protein RESTRICTED TEV MOVEMENT 2-like [Pistacia vera]
MVEKSRTCAANDDLEPKLSSYEDFHPFAELCTEDKDYNVLAVHLPGFKQQQIIITMLRPSHKIRIQGERICANNKRQKFNQCYKIPQNSNLNKIQARWENDFLRIMMPKETVTLLVAAAKDLEQAAVKCKTERQMLISAGVAALVCVAALAVAAFGAYVSCIIGSKS